MWVLVSEVIIFWILLALIVGYFWGRDLSINKEIVFRQYVQQEVKKIEKKTSWKKEKMMDDGGSPSLSNASTGSFSDITYKIERVIAHNKDQSFSEYKIILQDSSWHKLDPETFSKVVKQIYWKKEQVKLQNKVTSSNVASTGSNINYEWNNVLIYYGWPSVMNWATSLSEAEDYFRRYKLVILGAELENITHPDHNNTFQIINDLSGSTEFYGYVSPLELKVKFSYTWLVNEVLAWKDMWVKGVFIDDIWYDYWQKYKPGFTKSLYNSYILGIYNLSRLLGLKVIFNLWNPDDIFWVIPLKGDDVLTVESYYYNNWTKLLDYITHAKNYKNWLLKQQTAPKLLCIATAWNDNKNKVNEIAKEIWTQMDKDCFYHVIQDDFGTDPKATVIIPAK